MRNYFLGCLLLVLSTTNGFARSQKSDTSINIKTYVYTVKDSSQLALDVYNLNNNDPTIKKPCVVFVFGGAFVGGHRNDTIYNKYFHTLVQNNYTVVSISYSLGLKGVAHVSKLNVKPLKRAIQMAVEDLYDATNYLIVHRDSLGIDTSKIILSGSSAGAITVLEAAYWKSNRNAVANTLPQGFQYAGIVSFSGAILNFNWKLKYNDSPPPMMLFHGSADKIVPYKKIKFFNIGFYGSSQIAKLARKKNYPYYLYDYVGLGHEVSVIPMYENLPDILQFMETFVLNKKHYQINKSFKDPDAKPRVTLTGKELLEKLQKRQ